MVKHTRLKSEDIPTKKRIKSNSIYLINNQGSSNNLQPTTEGNIKTPTLETQIKGFL
jgi:hypothetical protein